MKHICIIATNLTEYQVLKPLVNCLYRDPDITVTQISADEHKDSQMRVQHFRIEEDGFTIEDDASTFFKNSTEYYQDSATFLQEKTDRFFKNYRPDIVVLFGNNNKTLKIAVTACLNDIPIAHIDGGQSDFGIWEDSYGFGITKLSHLHFAAAEKYRQQIIVFGENENSVFNTGSLLIERASSFLRPERPKFNRRIGLESEDNFILVDLHPDDALGSKNAGMLDQAFEALEGNDMDTGKIVFNLPRNIGIGKMMTRMIDAFQQQYENRVVLCDCMDLENLSAAVDHCDLLISNRNDSLVLASSKKKGAIHIARQEKNCIRPFNQVDTPAQKNEIMAAINRVMSDDFKDELTFLISPFEQSCTAEKIKYRLCEFTRERVVPKIAYPEPDISIDLFQYGQGNIVN